MTDPWQMHRLPKSLLVTPKFFYQCFVAGYQKQVAPAYYLLSKQVHLLLVAS
jgi:hypothetical protein